MGMAGAMRAVSVMKKVNSICFPNLPNDTIHRHYQMQFSIYQWRLGSVLELILIEFHIELFFDADCLKSKMTS